MQLSTILNRCHRFRGFVYQHARFGTDKKSIEVAVRPRKGSAAVCSRCHLPAPLSACEAGRLDDDHALVYQMVLAGVNVIAWLSLVRDFACWTLLKNSIARFCRGNRPTALNLPKQRVSASSSHLRSTTGARRTEPLS